MARLTCHSSVTELQIGVAFSLEEWCLLSGVELDQNIDTTLLSAC